MPGNTPTAWLRTGDPRPTIGLAYIQPRPLDSYPYRVQRHSDTPVMSVMVPNDTDDQPIGFRPVGRRALQ
jgi:hypothetical protein